MAENVRHAVSRPKLREKIIDAAVTLFEKKGIKGVTMDDIASSFGISKRTLYEVFTDKETLLIECVRRGQAEADDADAVVEVGAQAALPDQKFRVLVGSADNPHIKVDVSPPADAPHRLLLQGF